MKKEIPQSAIVGAIAAVILLVLGLGWFYLFRESDRTVNDYGGKPATPVQMNAGGRQKTMNRNSPLSADILKKQ